MEAHCPDVSTVTIVNEANQVITLDQVRAMPFLPLPTQNGATPPNPALIPPAVNPYPGAGTPQTHPLAVPPAVGLAETVAPAAAPFAIPGPPFPAVPYGAIPPNPALNPPAVYPTGAGTPQTQPLAVPQAVGPPAAVAPAAAPLAIPGPPFPAVPFANPGVTTTFPTPPAPAAVPPPVTSVIQQTAAPLPAGVGEVEDKVASLSAAVDVKLVQFESKMTSMLSSILAKMEDNPKTPPHPSSFAPPAMGGAALLGATKSGNEVIDVAGGVETMPEMGGLGSSSGVSKAVVKIEDEEGEETVAKSRKRRATNPRVLLK
jgi:hypothetical protein